MLDSTFKQQLDDLITQFIQDGGHSQTVVWNLHKIIDKLAPARGEEGQGEGRRRRGTTAAATQQDEGGG